MRATHCRKCMCKGDLANNLLEYLKHFKNKWEDIFSGEPTHCFAGPLLASSVKCPMKMFKRKCFGPKKHNK